MSEPLKPRSLAYLALLANALLWGLAAPIVKRGYADGLTPYTFLFGRMLVALIVSLPLILYLNRRYQLSKTIHPQQLTKIVPLELLGTVIALTLLYEGLRLTTAIEASLIAMTSPIFITIGGLIFLKEKIISREWLGFSLALLGTFLLVIKPLLSQGIGGNILGNTLILGQNLTVAIYYLLAKRQYQHFNMLAVTHISFWTGAISFFLIMIFLNLSPLSSLLSLFTLPSYWPIFAILYMAIPGSILGLTLYLYGQNKIEASEASLFTYLQPAFAVPASIMLLSETVSIIEVTASLVIVSGIILASKR